MFFHDLATITTPHFFKGKKKKCISYAYISPHATFLHQNSKWKIPTSQSGNDSLTDEEKIQQLISAESPYETFVLDVIKDKNIFVSKIGQYRKKKVTEYVKLFYDKLSLTHSANHLDDLTMSTSFMGESTHNDFPLMSVENDKKENSVLFFLNEDDYSFSHCNSATNAKPFHMFTNDDLQPQQCTAAFLYIVFRNPLVYESTFFKAGVRTFDESKQTFEQAKMENLRRYVTVFGPETEQFW
jgi:hypothetical protein